MSQPPRSGEQPAAGPPMVPQPGHPEPVPAPDPGPPQPIPPPPPAPLPEPPHAAAQYLEQATTEQSQQGGSERTEQLYNVDQLRDLEQQHDERQQADTEQFAAVRPDSLEHGPTRPDEVASGPDTIESVIIEPEIIEPDRSWHTPVPPGQQFHPSHEADWPTTPGQHQWLPAIHPEQHWQPQHEMSYGYGYEQHGAPEGLDAVLPASVVTAPGRKRRTRALVSVALALTLLMCGGGAVSAFLLLRDAEGGDGAPDPATAVTRFLSAVYAARDPAAANDLVCREVRDSKRITAKIDEVRGYSRLYDDPEFRWDEPAVATQDGKRATVSVDLTMSTKDEKVAEQELTFTVVKKTGWWVCEVAG